MEFYERIVNAFIDHWPLVAGLGLTAWWLFPRALKNTLNNGGGDIIRAIVRDENAKQTEHHRAANRQVTKIVNDLYDRMNHRRRRRK